MSGNLIPKIIHYVWLGGRELSGEAAEYVAEWKRMCPDYRIVAWTEDNVDLDECDYVKEAYAAKEYAFVADYIRLKALYEYGGIYLDTDVKLFRSFDGLLGYRAVLGFEDPTVLSSAVIMAAPKEKWVGDLLKYYRATHFKEKRNILPNTVLFTQYFKEYMGLKGGGRQQTLQNGEIFIGKRSLFSGKSFFTGEIRTDEDTIALHMFDGSWINKKSFENKVLKAAVAVFRESGVIFLKRIGLPFVYAFHKRKLKRKIGR